ncbi:MAG TPA: hypothetical protein PK333_02520 [Candidatus Moranbacteria bacterium]|nr:hypothetical protein [Candidatus Moranbacteria bacterium]
MIYIKIKHLKNFLMIVACLFLASFNYFTYAETTDENIAKSNVCDKNIDSDCDGLTNSEEKLYGTNLANADTDGDSYSDMVEIESGYDPLKPAPGDKIITAKTSTLANSENSAQSENSSMTENFSQELISLVQSKENQSITTAEVQSFVDEQLSKAMEENVSFETLPEIDRSQIKILEQNYSALNDKDRLQKEAEDAGKYLEDMLYLVINNSPIPLTSYNDIEDFREDFLSHLANLSDSNADLTYFADLGNRLELFSNQAVAVQVPENLVELHIKILRIIKGILTLQESPDSSDDPLARAILFTKAGKYVNLVDNFIQNDLKNHLERYNELSVTAK